MTRIPCVSCSSLSVRTSRRTRSQPSCGSSKQHRVASSTKPPLTSAFPRSPSKHRRSSCTSAGPEFASWTQGIRRMIGNPCKSRCCRCRAARLKTVVSPVRVRVSALFNLQNPHLISGHWAHVLLGRNRVASALSGPMGGVDARVVRGPGPLPTSWHHPLPGIGVVTTMKIIGEPCAGKPHARIERGMGKRA